MLGYFVAQLFNGVSHVHRKSSSSEGDRLLYRVETLCQFPKPASRPGGVKNLRPSGFRIRAEGAANLLPLFSISSLLIDSDTDPEDLGPRSHFASDVVQL